MHDVNTIEEAKYALLNAWNHYKGKEAAIYIYVRFETYKDAEHGESLRIVYNDKKRFEQSFIDNVALQFEFLEQIIDWDISLKFDPAKPQEFIFVDFYIEGTDNNNSHNEEATSFDIFDDRKQLHDFMLDFMKRHP